MWFEDVTEWVKKQPWYKPPEGERTTNPITPEGLEEYKRLTGQEYKSYENTIKESS